MRQTQKTRTRITKKLIKQMRADKQKTTYKKKNTVIPGPWSNIKTTLKIKPTLMENKSIYERIGTFYGAYKDTTNWSEKGWYPISINIVFKKLKETVNKHGLDLVLAACEKYLNSCLDENKKPRYGKLILLDVFSDNSQRDDPTKRFISCIAKTNKKRIVGFFANRKGKISVIRDEEEQEENQINQDSTPTPINLTNEIKVLSFNQ